MTSNNAFEWLSGGIFFGKKGDSESEIDNCKDVAVLLRGVNETTTELLHEGLDTASIKESSNAKNDSEVLFSARMRRIRFLLYDERRQSSQGESFRKTSVATKVSELLSGGGGDKDNLRDLIPLLLKNMINLPFEARKDFSAIFSYLLLCGLDGADADRYQTAMTVFRNYVHKYFGKIMPLIINNHDSGSGHAPTPDVILHAGSMFRSCVNHLCLYEKLVETTESTSHFIFPFLDKYVHSPNFDCAMDAMESLKILLTGDVKRECDPEAQNRRYKKVADFLERDYEAVWDQRFNSKLLSSKDSNYLIRRMALQILSIVLLIRANYKIMIKYVANKNNLILVMLLLRDKSPHITLDAFHVFKIFVVNPSKPNDVIKILSDNKDKLCAYLEGLHKEKEEKDSQFRDEKTLVISTIKAL